MYALHALALVLLAAGPAPAQQPIPPEDDLAQAEAAVQDVFGRDLAAARKPADKAALARRMLDTTAGSSPAERYALLVQARRLAIAARDATVGIQAVEGLAGFAPEKQRTAAAWASEGHRLWATGTDLATRLEAAECYLRALEGLVGFERAAAEKRLRELGWPKSLAIDELRRIFDLAAWRTDGDCLVGKVGLLGPSRIMSKTPIRSDRIEYRLSIKGPAPHYFCVEINGKLCAYLRGGWGNRGSSIVDQLNALDRKQLPGSVVTAPDDFHEMRATIQDRLIRFFYDGSEVYHAAIPPAAPDGYSIRLGFSGDRAELILRSVWIDPLTR